MNATDLTIILPTLNEEKQIVHAISAVRKVIPESHILVVDDGSKDQTQRLVRELADKDPAIHLVDRSLEPVKGLTESILVGIERVATPYFVVMDADLQHPPERIPSIYTLLREGASIVVGERERVLVHWPLHRRLISTGATGIARLRLTGKKFSVLDPVSGFFGGETSFVAGIIQKNRGRFESKGYKALFELLKFANSNSCVQTIKYDFGLRKGGASKMSHKHFFYFLRSLFR